MAPKLIEVRSSDDMRAMTESIREEAWRIMDYMDVLAPALKERIRKQFAKEGLTARGMSGVDAGDAVAVHLYKTADALAVVAAAVSEAFGMFNNGVVEPILQVRTINQEEDALRI
jgi:hypothetical protein